MGKVARTAAPIIDLIPLFQSKIWLLRCFHKVFFGKLQFCIIFDALRHYTVDLLILWTILEVTDSVLVLHFVPMDCIAELLLERLVAVASWLAEEIMDRLSTAKLLLHLFKEALLIVGVLAAANLGVLLPSRVQQSLSIRERSFDIFVVNEALDELRIELHRGPLLHGLEGINCNNRWRWSDTLEQNLAELLRVTRTKNNDIDLVVFSLLQGFN